VGGTARERVKRNGATSGAAGCRVCRIRRRKNLAPYCLKRVQELVEWRKLSESERAPLVPLTVHECRCPLERVCIGTECGVDARGASEYILAIGTIDDKAQAI
jgi:hypothetical protein